MQQGGRDGPDMGKGRPTAGHAALRGEQKKKQGSSVIGSRAKDLRRTLERWGGSSLAARPGSWAVCRPVGPTCLAVGHSLGLLFGLLAYKNGLKMGLKLGPWALKK